MHEHGSLVSYSGHSQSHFRAIWIELIGIVDPSSPPHREIGPTRIHQVITPGTYVWSFADPICATNNGIYYFSDLHWLKLLDRDIVLFQNFHLRH